MAVLIMLDKIKKMVNNKAFDAMKCCLKSIAPAAQKRRIMLHSWVNLSTSLENTPKEMLETAIAALLTDARFFGEFRAQVRSAKSGESSQKWLDVRGVVGYPTAVAVVLVIKPADSSVEWMCALSVPGGNLKFAWEIRRRMFEVADILTEESAKKRKRKSKSPALKQPPRPQKSKGISAQEHEAMQTQLLEAHLEVALLSEKLAEFEAKLAANTGELTQAMEKLSEAEHKISTAERELADANAKLSAAEAKPTEIADRLACALAELEAMKAELSGTKKKLSATEAKLAENEAKSAATKVELVEAKAELKVKNDFLRRIRSNLKKKDDAVAGSVKGQVSQKKLNKVLCECDDEDASIYEELKDMK